MMRADWDLFWGAAVACAGLWLLYRLTERG